MKRITSLIVLVFAVQTAFAEQPAVPAAPAAVPQAAAPAASQSAPVPKLATFVNGTSSSEILRGWPMILQAAVEHPAPDAAEAKPIVLSSKKGDWTKLVRVEVTDSEGVVHAWAFEAAPLMKPKAKISLEKGTSASLVYLLSPAETKRLEPGDYKVSAVIKAKKPDGTSFTVAKSPAIPLKVSDHPQTLTADQETARAKLEAVYLALKGDKAKAEQAMTAVQARPQTVQMPIPAGMPAQGYPQDYSQGYYAEPAYVPAQSSGASDILGLLASFGLGSMGSDYSDFDPSTFVDSSYMVGEGEDWQDNTDPGSGDQEIREPEEPEAPIEEENPEEDSDGVEGVEDEETGGVTDPDPGESEEDEGGPQVTNEYSGFIGPNLTIALEWVEPVNIDIWVENTEGIRRPETMASERGPGKEEFRPWDLSGMEDDRGYFVSAYLPPSQLEYGSFAKANVKFTVSLPGGAPQTFTKTLDEERQQDFWIAFRVDASTGAITPIDRFHTSIESYLAGDPQEGIELADPADPADPVDPVDPVDPGDPGDSTEPTDPLNPVDPTDPADPVDPGQPLDPADPVEPARVNRTGFRGPDMEFKLAWSESTDVDLWIENQNGIRRTAMNNEMGNIPEVFKPWDAVAQSDDTTYYVAALLKDTRPGQSANVTLTIKTAGGASPQFTGTVDNIRGKNCWIALRIDCATGRITPVNGYGASVRRYFRESTDLQNDPETEITQRDFGRRPAFPLFTGPDTTVTLSWDSAEPDVKVDLVVQNQDGEARPVRDSNGQRPLYYGVPACQKYFQPWNIREAEFDTKYIVAVQLTDPRNTAVDVKLHVCVPGRVPTRKIALLDHRLYRNTWIAFEVDALTGNATQINTFDATSLDAWRAQSGN